MTRIAKVMKTLLLLIILLSFILLAYAYFIEPHMLNVRRLSSNNPFVDPAHPPIKVAIFSDVHIRSTYTEKDFKKVVDLINQEEPDLVLFLGDLFDHFSRFREERPTACQQIEQLLASIKAPLGKYAVFGNHDYGGGGERYYKNIMKTGGFTILYNQAVDLAGGIRLIGIDDMSFGRGDPHAAAQADPDRYNLLFTHAPDIAAQMDEYPIDFIVAGHTHGRQINLPFFDEYVLPAYGRKYPRGEYPLANQRAGRLYVTTGIGTTLMPLRFLSQPEIVILSISSPANEHPESSTKR